MESRRYEIKEIGALAKNIQGGDKNAVAEIYEAIRPAMVKKAYKQLNCQNKNTHNAEDVFEDTFIKCMSRIDTLQNPESFVYWFSVSITNNANNWNKKNDASRMCSFSDLEGDQTNYTEHKESPLEKAFANAAYYGEENHEDDVNGCLAAAMNQINKEQRELLELLYIEKYSYQEICAMKKMKYSTLVGKIQTAKKKLKHAIFDVRIKEGDISINY